MEAPSGPSFENPFPRLEIHFPKLFGLPSADNPVDGSRAFI